MKPVTTLTKAQISAYWRAASAGARNLGEPVEKYRKNVMFEVCGLRSMRDLNRTTDFDRVMARFLADAGDYESAAKYAVGDSLRKAVLIRICCAQVMQLLGTPFGSSQALEYLAGIMRQANLQCGYDSGFWMDCPPASLTALFAMLDTHRRRLLKRLFNGDSAHGFLRFDPSVVYTVKPSGGVSMVFNKEAYSDLNSIRLNIR